MWVAFAQATAVTAETSDDGRLSHFLGSGTHRGLLREVPERGPRPVPEVIPKRRPASTVLRRVPVRCADGARLRARVDDQAGSRGRTGGQKPKLGPRQVKLAREMYDETGEDGKRKHTVATIAAEFGVSRPTIYRHLGKTTGPGSAAS